MILDKDTLAQADHQTATGPFVERQRAKAIADLAPLVGERGARDIVEALGGSVGQMRASAERIARIIDGALCSQRARDTIIRAADTCYSEGVRAMEESRRDARTDPRHSGAMRGIAFSAFEAAEVMLGHASEIGK